MLQDTWQDEAHTLGIARGGGRGGKGPRRVSRVVSLSLKTLSFSLCACAPPPTNTPSSLSSQIVGLPLVQRTQTKFLLRLVQGSFLVEQHPAIPQKATAHAGSGAPVSLSVSGSHPDGLSQGQGQRRGTTDQTLEDAVSRALRAALLKPTNGGGGGGGESTAGADPLQVPPPTPPPMPL